MRKKRGATDKVDMGRESLKEKAYQSILDDFLNGAIKVNEPIREEDIARKLEMSRTPIREAIRLLESKGLVTSLTNRGCFFKMLTETDVKEIWELRKMFELQALRDSINVIPDEEIQRGIEDLMHLSEKTDHYRYFSEENSFHSMILRYCYNKRLRQYVEDLKVQVERLRRLTNPEKYNSEYVKEKHLKLFKALQKRDLDEASKLLEAHLDELYGDILKVCKLDYMS